MLLLRDDDWAALLILNREAPHEMYRSDFDLLDRLLSSVSFRKQLVERPSQTAIVVVVVVVKKAMTSGAGRARLILGRSARDSEGEEGGHKDETSGGEEHVGLETLVARIP